MIKEYRCTIHWADRIVKNRFHSKDFRKVWLSGVLKNGFYDYDDGVETWYPPQAILKVESFDVEFSADVE